jgi:23S rRNA U2552 (ribose-2'-O)-methylase RlmE/FtsJ
VTPLSGKETNLWDARHTPWIYGYAEIRINMYKSNLRVSLTSDRLISIAEVDHVNKILSDSLCSTKNLIEEHGKNGKWDHAKTFTNPFELVYKTNTVKVVPVSRAFFKIWEVVQDAFILPLEPVKIAYVAEGPGGFIQGIVEYRKKQPVDCSLDRHVAITLVSRRRSVPCWKLSREWVEENNVEFCYGDDGTGDIYNVGNVRRFSEYCSGFDIVTADGGFDFSNDFNSQETNVLRMLISEVLCALLILRDGGSFIFKTFDTLSRSTSCIIQILVKSFNKVVCTKPLSSRPANSEKYFVCTGFKRDEGCIFIDILESLLSLGKRFTVEDVYRALELNIDVYYNVCLVNISMVYRQLCTILKTLQFINTSDGDEETKKQIRLYQDELAFVWTRNFKCL